MLDYVLAWLAANNVDEVFVFCCAHAELVMEHVEKYGGRLAGGAALHTVVSTGCTSAGEALRLIYEQNIVRTLNGPSCSARCHHSPRHLSTTRRSYR